ncbi:MAG: hypothetical protein JNK84_06055 [Phreatobacter sp.]|uniref:hypothetical protein n=1 Tax=Phreatobacter sp. TaxID=1966341 RepID=UPI001A5A6A53|nr:hypothetical protein [Phreatobacter sp.]MBL8568631.1 hypothetical protein [Phreatobacter sp.]
MPGFSTWRTPLPLLALLAGLAGSSAVCAADDAAPVAGGHAGHMHDADDPARRARLEFDRYMAGAPRGELPRLADPATAPMLRAIWDGIGITPARRFGARDVPSLFRTCSSGQAVLARYFAADSAAAGASGDGFWPEILEGIDFMIRCSAALLQANAEALQGQLPGLAFAESRVGAEQLRGQLVEQFNGPLRAIAAGALAGEAVDRITVALRETGPRVAGSLPTPERDALLELVRAAAAKAGPLARADLETFADVVASR